MDGQLKPVFQKDLKHWSLHLPCRGVAIRFGLNVVVLGISPGRISRELVVLKIIGIQYQAPQWKVRHYEPALNGLKECSAVRTSVPLYGCNFESGACGWQLRLAKALPNGKKTEHKKHKKDTKGTRSGFAYQFSCASWVLPCAFCAPSHSVGQSTASPQR